MPQFNVHMQIDIIMAAFTLHNYILINSIDDQMFFVIEQHPYYIHHDELLDIQDSFINNGNVRETSNEMRYFCNNIASLLWIQDDIISFILFKE